MIRIIGGPRVGFAAHLAERLPRKEIPWYETIEMQKVGDLEVQMRPQVMPLVATTQSKNISFKQEESVLGVW